ncbi:hypothetical protein HMPREF0476_0493 [Kingella kingae ATCC 23330]|uniref:Uncharacterized protein n=1 Tax=Kingella kingae ATCC 23330 TaxID=887327 RepID=F5S5L0_KINKI|nr:hypothetical protein HMPREF0476_0493 [Kingella kingae ATCC 23330]
MSPCPIFISFHYNTIAQIEPNFETLLSKSNLVTKDGDLVKTSVN